MGLYEIHLLYLFVSKVLFLDLKDFRIISKVLFSPKSYWSAGLDEWSVFSHVFSPVRQSEDWSDFSPPRTAPLFYPRVHPTDFSIQLPEVTSNQYLDGGYTVDVDRGAELTQ